MNKQPSLRILFVGDDSWGSECGSPQMISDWLWILYPRINFEFIYNSHQRNSVAHLFEHRAKEIIGKDPSHVVLWLGVKELEHLDFDEYIHLWFDFLREIRKTITGKIWAVTIPPLFYEDETAKLHAAKLNEFFHDSSLFLHKVIPFDLYFQRYIDLQAHKENDHRSLHNSKKELTRLGICLLSKLFLDSFEP
jgi:hypothetical protein